MNSTTIERNAGRDASKGNTDRDQQFVLLTIGTESYAVEISTVHGILMPQTVTEIPNTPAFVRGVTNLRGEVLTVIDMRARFGLDEAPQAFHRQTRFVVIETMGKPLALVVDAVTEVVHINDADVDPPGSLFETEVHACIDGVAKLKSANGTRLAMILNVEALMKQTLRQTGQPEDQE